MPYNSAPPGLSRSLERHLKAVRVLVFGVGQRADGWLPLGWDQVVRQDNPTEIVTFNKGLKSNTSEE
jgi:hypothetical protein